MKNVTNILNTDFIIINYPHLLWGQIISKVMLILKNVCETAYDSLVLLYVWF